MDGAGFTPKTVSFDWSILDRFNLENLTNGSTQDDEALDGLYEQIIEAKPDLNDPRSTPENLAKLFHLTQLCLELSHIYLNEAEERADKAERVSSPTGFGGDTRQLQRELFDLEQRTANAVRDLQAAEKALMDERKRTGDLVSQLRERDERIRDLNHDVHQLQEDAAEYKSQLVKLREDMAGKENEESNLKENEVARCLNEIQSLHQQNNALRQDLEALTAELEVVVTTLDNSTRVTEERDVATKAVIQSDAKRDELLDECNELKLRLEDLMRQTEVKDAAENEMLASAKEQIQEWKDQVIELTKDLALRDKEIKTLQEDQERMTRDFEIAGTAQIYDTLNQKDLTKKLDDAQKEFEALSLDWNRLDRIVRGEQPLFSDFDRLPALNREHKEAIENLKKELDTVQELYDASVERLKVFEKTLVEKENEIVTTTKKLNDIEAGVYGLSEAEKEIRDLKVQRSIRDENIIELTKEANKYAKAVDELLEENQELRQQLGLDTISPVDLSELKRHRGAELEKLKAMNRLYKQEIDRLEEERVELKNKVRIQTMEIMPLHSGLTEHDIHAIEEMAASLKSGKMTKQRAIVDLEDVPSQKQLDTIAHDLERVYHELKLSRQERQEVEHQLKSALEENEYLRAAIRDISDALKISEDKNGSSATQSLVTVEAMKNVEKLILVLEARRNRRPSSSSTHVSHLDDNQEVAIDDVDLLKANQVLRTESANLKSDLRKAKQMIIRRDQTIKTLGEECNQFKNQLETIKHEAPLVQLIKRVNLNADSSEVIAGTLFDLSPLVDQLAECLKQLDEKDVELNRLNTTLSEQTSQFEELYARQMLLYKSYHNLREHHNLEFLALKKENEKIANEKQEKEKLLEELNLLISQKPEAADLDVARENALLKAKESKYLLTIQSMESSEKLLRKEFKQLRYNLLAQDRASSERIRHLYSQRRHLMTELERVRQDRIAVVPEQTFLDLQNRFNLLNEKYRALLEKEAQFLSLQAAQDENESQLKAQQMRLDELQLKLESEKSLTGNLKTALSQYAEAEESLKNSAESRQLPIVARAYEKAASLESQLNSAQHTLKFMEKKVAAYDKLESELRKTIQELSTSLAQEQTEKLTVREELVCVQEQLSKTCSPTEYEQMKQNVNDLKNQVVQLQDDLDTHKHMADVSVRQVTEISIHQASLEKEVELCRKTLREFETTSDVHALVGKLQTENASLQKAEAIALETVEKCQACNRELQADLRKVETRLENREKEYWDLRIEYRLKIRNLEKQLSRWDERFGRRFLENDMTPTFQLEKSASYSMSILNQLKNVQKHLDNASKKKVVLENQITELQAKCEVYQGATSFLKNVPQKVTELVETWQQRMIASKSTELGLQRQLQNLRERDESLARNVLELKEKVGALESDLLKNELEMERLRLERDKQELFYHTQLAEYEEKIQMMETNAKPVEVSI